MGVLISNSRIVFTDWWIVSAVCYSGAMARFVATLAALLTLGLALFAAGELADHEGLRTAGAWLTIPMTALLGLLMVVAVFGYAGAAVVTAVAYLARALRR